jgi:hypothetical protein
MRSAETCLVRTPESRMMRKCHVRFGGGRMEKVHLCAVHRWNLASRLPYVIVWNERSLRRHLQRYLVYYNDVSYCPTSLCG